MPGEDYYRDKAKKQIERVENQGSAEDIQRYVDIKRANGIKWSTLSHSARSIADLANEYPENPLADLEEEDLIRYVAGIADEYADSTMQRVKVAIKNGLNLLYGDGEDPYPPVKWMNTSHNSKGRKDPDELLTRDDIKAIIEACDHPRDRALIACLYESGARRGEFLGLNIRNVEIDDRGAVIRLNPEGDNKTGTRRIRLIQSAVYLQNWIENHPNSQDRDAPLWISLDQSRHGERLSEPGIRFLVKKLGRRADLDKHVHPHLFRHSRATELASKGYSESEMRIMLGWADGSDMPSRYIHMSGEDVEEKMLKMHGLLDEDEESTEDPLEPWECNRCGRENAPDSPFCNCGRPRDLSVLEEVEKTETDASQDLDAETLELAAQLVEKLQAGGVDVEAFIAE